MKKLFLSFMSMLIVFTLLAPSVSAQNNNISGDITNSIKYDHANDNIIDDKLSKLVDPFLSPYVLTIVIALAVYVGQQGQKTNYSTLSHLIGLPRNQYSMTGSN